MIILEPIGGLGNRMRVISSGIRLKEKLSTGLRIVWNENYELNCPFHLLFEPIPGVTIIKKKRIYYHLRSTHSNQDAKEVRNFVARALTGVDHCFLEHDFVNDLLPNGIGIGVLCSPEETLYIQTCQEFENFPDGYRYFKPVPALADKIGKITSGFAPRTLGMHIRGTDNLPAAAASPVELFIEMIKRELKDHPETKFFLCTDSDATKKMIVGRFGDRIITTGAELSRGSITGIQDAVVEMFCLARTALIYGSYYSSYSEIAAHLLGAELKVLQI